MTGPLLPTSRLTRIRQRWEANLPETCTILPLTDTRDVGAVDDLSYPDPTDPNTTGLVTMKCRWRPDSAADRQNAQQDESRLTGRLQCPVSSRLSPTDRLYVVGVDASGGAWSLTLEIIGPLGPRTWEAVREVRCAAILPVTNVTEENA